MLFACLSLSACTSGPTGQPKQLPVPGTVMAERWTDLGFGFREVTRSQVNPTGSFEGIGHFVFVYFRDENLCQCSRSEVSIAPDGSRMLYTDVADGKLMLFIVSSRKRVELTQEFVGYPTGATWDLLAKKALVTLERGNRSSITVPL